MKLTPVGLALLFSSLTLGAQDRNGPTVQAFPKPDQINSLVCPVGMQAQYYRENFSATVLLQNWINVLAPLRNY